jgi:parallel beta-helix repeat protein
MHSLVLAGVISLLMGMHDGFKAMASDDASAKDVPAAGTATASEITPPTKVIAIRENETVVGVRVFDETSLAEVSGSGGFTRGDGGRLVFKRLPKAPRSQIFHGFTPGDVVFEAGCFGPKDVVLPEWWGANNSGEPTSASASANVVAINATLAAVAKSPLAVSLNGVYFINEKIRPQSGNRLMGDGHGVLKAVANISLRQGECLVVIDGQSDVTIDGIEVDGNRASQKQDVDHVYGGIIVIRSNHCAIKNCKVHDCNGQLNGGAVGNGIRTHAASDITISGNEIYSNNGCGINIYNRSARIRIANNRIFNNCEIGIESEGRGENYTDFRNSAITIENNDIRGSDEPGRRDDHSILVDWTDHSTITGNRCCNSTHNGIEILGCTDILVAENHCEKNGDVGPPYSWAGVRVTAEGFHANGHSSNIIIRDNEIVGSQYGVYLDTADHVRVLSNKITKAIHGSLMVGGLTDAVEVSGNVLGAVDK